MKIIVSPDVPRMQLSEDCPVTPEFREQCNAWMVEFFGMHNMIEDGVYLTLNGAIYMNPRTYEQFKAAIRDAAHKLADHTMNLFPSFFR